MIGTVLVVTLLSVAVAGTQAAQAQPPTLDGQVLVQNLPFNGATTGNCSTDSGTGTTTYELSFAGTAPTGQPYPGPFTEEIQVSIGPPSGILPLGLFPGGFNPGAVNPSQFLSAGQLLSFAATFAIDSPSGDVTGTKTLSAVVPADATHAGVCAEFTNLPSPAGPVTGAYKDARAFDLTYQALITNSEGTFRDRGDSQAQGRQGHIDNAGGVVSDVNDFGETFSSDVSEPEALRMVGKGAIAGTTGGSASYAYIVRCASAGNTNAPFEVRFGAQRFRLTSTSNVTCADDPAVSTPSGGFDTQTGTGAGTLTTGVPGTIEWTFVDGGAGGASDSAQITIRNAGGTVVFQGSSAPPGQFPASSQATGNNTAQAVPGGGGTS